jgi:hypothetical protein
MATTAGWIDTTWDPGATCHYAVVACDAARNISASSATVSVTPNGSSKRRQSPCAGHRHCTNTKFTVAVSLPHPVVKPLFRMSPL